MHPAAAGESSQKKPPRRPAAAPPGHDAAPAVPPRHCFLRELDANRRLIYRP
eukprot:COSAG01_NODE_61338_length_290_cov_0.748691_1_plen_51_part_10